MSSDSFMRQFDDCRAVVGRIKNAMEEPKVTTENQVLRAALTRIMQDATGMREAVSIAKDALAAQPASGEAEPVVVIGSGWQFLWASGDSIESIVKRHGLKIGSKLYTTPPASQEQAKCGDCNCGLQCGDVAAYRAEQAQPSTSGFIEVVGSAPAKLDWGDGTRAPIEPGPMTAGKAAYFMRRFRNEEKLLGPNEQAALDFVVSMLEAQPITANLKDCATCAHQGLPAYAPRCQQCNRLASGARRNWQAQPSTCAAVQHSDQMVCDRCKAAWDVNDPEPPECLPASADAETGQ
jgi:hypothetical protein